MKRSPEEDLSTEGQHRTIQRRQEGRRHTMSVPVLYYWAPCTTCEPVVHFADAHGIEIDKRDVEQQAPYDELLALGGDANAIPYLSVDGELINGVDACIAYLMQHYA